MEKWQEQDGKVIKEGEKIEGREIGKAKEQKKGVKEERKRERREVKVKEGKEEE